jgi:hypothetical protein
MKIVAFVRSFQDSFKILMNEKSLLDVEAYFMKKINSNMALSSTSELASADKTEKVLYARVTEKNYHHVI